MTKDEEIERLKKHSRFASTIIHNLVVANQAAWIEWKNGGGSEKAMHWIHNGLCGPGHIPNNSEEQTAQEWFDSNVVDHDQKMTQ
ncbi:MAG: hypothetical protein KUG82_01655 [Pseudomonadales bacterium]|nr:hypothetical protein [Pseudomonadales bacterium]